MKLTVEIDSDQESVARLIEWLESPACTMSSAGAVLLVYQPGGVGSWKFGARLYSAEVTG